MTIFNDTLSGHQAVSLALQNLSNALVKADRVMYDPSAHDLKVMFYDVAQQDDIAEEKTIQNLSASGERPRISDELYNPSTDIFDDDIILPSFPTPDSDDQYKVDIPDVSGSDDIHCASVYIIRKDNIELAVIKNYHTLTKIEYSVTSSLYPLYLLEAIQPIPMVLNARLGDPYMQDAIDVSPILYSISYPISIGYRDYTVPHEGLDLTPGVISLSYPLTVNYITTTMAHEGLDLTPSVIQLSFGA